MSVLDRKLLRDCLRLAPQLAAVAVVMACGVAVLVMSWSMLRSLDATQQAYAREAHFADVFVHLERAPKTIARQLAAIDGVARLETRVVQDVTLDLRDPQGRRLPAVGRLISLPTTTDNDTSRLNRLHLLKGRLPEETRPSEAVVGAGFAEAHRLQPGDQVVAILNGRRTQLDLVGIATSPEYVYTIGPSGPFPDDRSFGVFWMSRQGLAAAFDMTDAFNDVVASLNPGTSLRDVRQAIDRQLDRYGGLGSFGREFQTSHRYLTNELRELRNMSRVAPVVFLAVTAILMHLVVSRLIGTQREQIAALAAFGYTPLEIASHFVKLAIVVLACGAALGVPLGWWLGVNLAQMYTRFFRFPELTFHLDGHAVAWSVVIASLAALAGVGQAVGRAVRIRPAAAMQPEPPAVYRVSLLERLGVGPLLAPTTRMMLRHLERRPAASGLSILGLALGAAVMVLGMFVGDAIEHLANFQFTQVQRFDRSVAFVEPVGRDAVAELARLPGVQAVEPFRVAAATLRFRQRERRQELMATEPDAELFRILDMQGQVHQPCGNGLLVSRRLAELLGASLGDTIEVDLLEGRRPTEPMVIAGLVDDMVGTSAWLPGEVLQRLQNEGPRFSGAFLAIDEAEATSIDARLADSPRVAGFVSRQRQLDTFRETIAQTLLRMRTVNTLFAIAIACGVVATTARQSVIERSRDLASLRVLGYTRREVAGILISEQALLTLAAVPLGLVLGLGFVHVTTWGYDTDLFRVPAVVHPQTYATSAATVFAAALVTAGIVRRLLDRLDLVSVLKVRD